LLLSTYRSGYRLAISVQPRVLPDRGGRKLSCGDFEQLNPAVLVGVGNSLVSTINILTAIHK
jgi:hypothetical protein